MPKRVDPKDPHTEEVFEFDCGSIMATGDTVASVESVFVQSGDADELDLLTPPATSDDAKHVSLMVGRGLPSSWYVLVCRFRTAVLGELLDLELEFYVKAA